MLGYGRQLDAFNGCSITRYQNQVRTATSSDTDMLSLLSIIEEGMPDHRSQLPPHFRDYHQFWEHLYSIDGVVIYKGSIVIPPSLGITLGFRIRWTIIPKGGIKL